MSTPTVRSAADGPVGRITIDAPERLGAVDPDMCDAITDALTAFDADPAVRVVALGGTGRGFCSGAPLSAEGAQMGVLEAGERMVRAIVGSSTPVVALVHGVAAGIGVPMALACDYALTADEAPFVLAFSRIGLMPDGGATALVTAAVGRARSMRLALTGEALDGATAAQWGLVAESVPTERFEERAGELLAAFAAGPPLAYAETKAAVNAAALDLDAAFAREDAGQRRLGATEDHREGAAAFVGKRRPTFHGR
ncbi:enoyl-CoA hydratase/isomerase family protein [Phycicoccus sp. BSK3Z-2]|uniref:Enoyl-CoA hydratase/isomerase family protein n=1 Tax=Phycicoccus avicenniae TaxID=2828860 RepID=A0A941D744_9MICO|nr:enoyl-CoA hydratase-related protein [Phycicoccus avicenniae]MBR7741752.1 enoyl-CoA hydratase/isomerase family protein [Phycicoccus avicenniae]